MSFLLIVALCCRGPWQDLVGDIKDLAFIGNGSFAAVFKGETRM